MPTQQFSLILCIAICILFIENREYIGNKEIQLSKLEHKEKNWGFFENINMSESEINKYSEFDLRKELEKKFDELFGPID